MYRIIGADQKEYGPITADQVRFWVTEGRINAQTRACAEGTNDWKPLGSFPEFAEVFGAQAAAAAQAPIGPVSSHSFGGRDAALRAVKGPAIAILITAALGALYFAFNGIFALAGGGALFHQELPANLSPQMKSFIEGMRGPFAGVFNLIVAVVDGFIVFGAVKMMRLQSWGLAMATCIVALLPCQCCCLFGLPFGIWGLVMLNKPEVKSQFE